MIDRILHAGDFNGLAADYDRFRIGYSPELFDVLAGMGLRHGAHVLDAGCGTGISMRPLVARGLNLTGVDRSAQMLALAQATVPSATLVEGSVEALPFAAGSFDGAVCAQAFHWFAGDAAFAELIRVVKPGGPVAVWWKVLGADDPMRSARATACARLGLEPAPDPLRGGFGAFYRAPFAERALRVLPFTARFTIDDWIGYERSRASARNFYGSRAEAYIDALRTELLTKHSSPGVRFAVRYTQLLYVGTTARA